MTWQQTLHEDSFTAKDFLFADGRQMDLRLAYWTLANWRRTRAMLSCSCTVRSAADSNSSNHPLPTHCSARANRSTLVST